MMIRPASRAEVLDVCQRVARTYPVIGGGLVDRHLAPDDAAWTQAERALGYLQAKHPEGLDDVLEAFATVSTDFLRLQARFMKNRRYARSDSSELVSDLYADDEKMSGYYLDGLAMTYVLWPNHARMITFFADEFVPRLPPGSRVVEVGVGHGLMAAMLFESVADLRYVGVDISPSSLAYAESALAGLGVPAERWSMVHADALAGDLAGLSGGAGFDGLVCCEVLEHVDEPLLLMSNLAASLRPGRRGVHVHGGEHGGGGPRLPVRGRGRDPRRLRRRRVVDRAGLGQRAARRGDLGSAARELQRTVPPDARHRVTVVVQRRAMIPPRPPAVNNSSTVLNPSPRNISLSAVMFGCQCPGSRAAPDAEGPW